MIRTSEKFVSEIIRGERTGWIPLVIKTILIPLGWLYSAIVAFRNLAYDMGILKQFHSSATVVSIGNINAGGTGKTPLTLLLAREMRKWGKLAILSRGYRSKAEKSSTSLVLTEGKKKLFSAEDCGDEPCLLADNLPGVSIIVGKDRVQSAQLAVASGAKMILMDDGMQHRRLARDFEIVVIDANAPLGFGRYLPSGLLRDSPRSLSRADIIFINRVKDSEQLKEIESLLKPHSSAQIVAAKNKFLGAWLPKGEAVELKGKRVGIFCAIAQPQGFYETVKQEGGEIVFEFALADHETITPSALQEIAEKSLQLGADLLLCTEKDWVKFDEEVSLPLPLAWVQVSLEIIQGEESWRKLVDYIRLKVQKEIQFQSSTSVQNIS
jgi:tetraacyldisaccharide 4'-kinase